MLWQELSIQVPPEYVEPVSYLFGRYGLGLSVETIGDGLVLLRTYLPNTSRRRMARIEVGVNLVRSIEPMGELQVKEIEEADWESAWKAHFTLLNVGRRLVIKPSWIEYEPRPDDVVIELDPGMAFGTGYHPTTRMCLEALENLVRPGMRVLDLGTGSGILTIAAAKLGASPIVALDTDPIAVKVARRNLRACGLTTEAQLARGSLPHRLAPDGRFDLAMANITLRVIQEAAPYLWRSLRPGGALLASGIIEDQRADLEERLESTGFSRVESVRHRGLGCLAARQAGMTTRFFVPPTWIDGERARLEGELARQVSRVLRLAPGDEVTLLDNSGREFGVLLTRFERDTVEGVVQTVSDSGNEPAVEVTLYQALLKGERFEWVLQKGTELGVKAFIPVMCQRSIPRGQEDRHHLRYQRWRKHRYRGG